MAIMVTSRPPTLIRLTIFTLLLSLVLTQNDTAVPNDSIMTDPNQCPLRIYQDFNSDATINSTGSVRIHWNALMMDPTRNDWIFTLTYNETRDQQAASIAFDTRHYLQAYISAPEASEAQACVYMFGGLNATALSSQQSGCARVLDDACYNFLSNVTFSSGCTLPARRVDWLSGLEEVCGSHVAKFVSSTSNAQDFTNQTCSIDHPPGSTALDNYRTWAAMGRGYIDGNVDTNPSSFIWYDTYVRQVIPFLVTANFLGGVTETQVICVAPKEVVDGGRVPAKTSAASLSWLKSNWVAVTVFAVVSSIGAYL